MKKMKFLALFLSFVFIVSAVGCKKSDNNSTITSSKAMIAGWLMDAGENLLSEKTVKLTHVKTEAALTTKTDSNGEYYFTDLDAGEYKLSVTTDEGSDITSEETYTIEAEQNLYLKIIFDGSTLKITVIDDSSGEDNNTSGGTGSGTSKYSSKSSSNQSA